MFLQRSSISAPGLGNLAPMGEPETGDSDGLRHRGYEPHLIRDVFRTSQVLRSHFTLVSGSRRFQ